MDVMTVVGIISGLLAIVISVGTVLTFAVNYGRVLQRIDTMERDINGLGGDGKKVSEDFKEIQLAFVELKGDVKTLMSLMQELSRDLKDHLRQDKEE